jgi:cytochrome c
MKEIKFIPFSRSRKMTRTLAALLLSPALVLTVSAQDATPAEAEALVKEAIAFAKANGKEAAFKEITKIGGKFHRHGVEMYVFVYDLDGKVLAHGQGANRIGVNQSNAKDPDGKEFIKERINLAKTKGKGWHDYKFPNPTTKKLEAKTSYIEVWDGAIFGCGIYKK